MYSKFEINYTSAYVYRRVHICFLTIIYKNMWPRKGGVIQVMTFIIF
jgi:hypothetical protein